MCVCPRASGGRRVAISCVIIIMKMKKARNFLYLLLNVGIRTIRQGRWEREGQWGTREWRWRYGYWEGVTITIATIGTWVSRASISKATRVTITVSEAKTKSDCIDDRRRNAK